jgi:hypothetical protein
MPEKTQPPVVIAVQPADPAAVKPRPGIQPGAIPTVNKVAGLGTAWCYMHAAPNEFGDGGTRYNQRNLIVDGDNVRLQGLVIDGNGGIDQRRSREWRWDKTQPATAWSTTPMNGRWTDAANRDSLAPQTLDLTAYPTVHVWPGDQQTPPAVAFIPNVGTTRIYTLTSVWVDGDKVS